jgi:L-ascorbate metabolism protein UlaG (beta-lactamase superfamily)
MKTQFQLAILILFSFFQMSITANDEIPALKIHYLGHCAFILQFDDTVSVIADYAESYPYYSRQYISPIYSIYGEWVPDVATYSHQHADHFSPSRLPDGVSTILQNVDTLWIKDLHIKPVRTSESNTGTPDNSTYFFRYKGLNICHSGDLDANMKAINNAGQQAHLRELFPDTVDVLLLVIQSTEDLTIYAEKFIDFLKPRIVIPMHYWTPADKSEFLAYLENENSIHGKSYEIEQIGGADYDVFLNDTNQHPTRVVSLVPSPFGDPAPLENDLAFGSKAYSNSILDINHHPDRATDGFGDTRWQSEWGATTADFIINLEEERALNGLVFRWLNWIKAYEIQLSIDSVDWNTVYSVANHDNIKADSAVFDQTNAKFVLIRMTQSGSDSGYGLSTLGVFEDLPQNPNSLDIVPQPGNVFWIYPQPASDKLNIKYLLRTPGEVSLKLVDSAGLIRKSMMDQGHQAGIYTINLNTGDLSSGVYLLEIFDGQNSHNQFISIIRY